MFDVGWSTVHTVPCSGRARIERSLPAVPIVRRPEQEADRSREEIHGLG